MVYKAKEGIIKERFNRLSLFFVGLMLALAASLAVFPAARAAHNGAVISPVTGVCGETTFSAAIADPTGTHKVNNMRLVVSADGTTQNVLIPTDGSEATITVGPFTEDTTIQWRVFGGGERSYDQPAWDGFGDPSFNADVSAYGTANGFDFVVAGPEDTNPFTTWNQLNVEGCPPVKEDCKDGGYATLGFRNQGQCIRFVNTGQDSR